MRLRRAVVLCAVVLLGSSGRLEASDAIERSRASGGAGSLAHVAAPLEAAEGESPNDPDFQWKEGWSESPEWGGRIGYVDARGVLRVRARSQPEAPWVVVAKSVKSFQLFDWRLAVLKTDGRLFQQEGPLDAPLRELAANVCAYQLTLTRTGILRCDHTLLVRESGSDARTVASGVKAFQVDVDRVVVLGFDGVLWGQMGGEATRGFQRLADKVRAFQIEREYLAFVQETSANGRASSRLMVAKWEFSGPPSFIEEAKDVSDFEMEVAVDYARNFQSTLRLAVIANGTVLSAGAGEALPLKMRQLEQAPWERVAWGGGRLAAVQGGRLVIGSMGTDGTFEGFESLPGSVSSFRISQEGALAVNRGSAGVDLFETTTEEANAETGARRSLKAEPREFALAPGHDVQVSSIRPQHVRRAAFGPKGPSDPGARMRTASVRFANDPETTTNAPADGPTRAAAARLIRPLSQATSVPLYQLYTAGYTDHFYTTSPSERDIAISLGYVDQGIACYVEPTQLAGTLPFWRFYASSQTNHFYTTSRSEYDFVVANGFTYEGIEGYLYSAQAPGTLPLHRLAWWNPGTGDLDHYYTTSDAAKSSLLSQGWSYDGVAGYVWGLITPGVDDAAGGAVSVPLAMTAGQTYAASVTMTNTGGTTWTAAKLYRLGSQNPQDNMTWGLARVELPGSVSPGSSVTFRFNVVAPATAGTFKFQWRMVREGVNWFGASTANQTITVSAVANRPPLGYLDSVQTANSSVNGWAYDPDVPSQSIGVHFDIDGAPAGDAVADQDRPDVDTFFGITGKHGFGWSVPAAYRSGTHTIHAYAVDATSGARIETGSSPLTFTYPVGTFSISGNAGVPGATVSAGTSSATSNDAGDFTISKLPAGTYTLSASKSGCAFYPATVSVTVGPDRTRVFFTTPCRLNYVRGDTPYADKYIQNFPYGAMYTPPAFKAQEFVYTRNDTYTCTAYQLPSTLCAPLLPLWASRDNWGNTCASLKSVGATRTHIRPSINAPSRFAPNFATATYVPFAPNCYYDCDWCFPEGWTFGACSPNQLCAELSTNSYLVVADPIGERGLLTCTLDRKSFQGHPNGAASRSVYVGEISPDWWGIVPIQPDLMTAKQYQILVAPGRQVQADNGGIGTTLRSGDAYWDKFPTMIAPPPLMGGGEGPACIDGNIQCEWISSRARGSLVAGSDGTLRWVITISGYFTGDNPIKNTTDFFADQTSFGQIELGRTVYVNDNVAAVIQFMSDHNAYNAILLGHSLGAADALVIYQLGLGSSVTTYAAPFLLSNSVFLQTTSQIVDGIRPVFGYGGVFDLIANVGTFGSCLTTNTCRYQLCVSTGRCSFVELDTGQGFSTFNNPHDRCKYQMAIKPGTRCW